MKRTPFILVLVLSAWPVVMAQVSMRDQAFEAQRQGRTKEAMELFSGYLEKNPGDSAAAAAAAELYASQGMHSDAAMLLTRAVAANPADEKLAYRLAAQEAFARRTADARWRFERLSESDNRQLAAMAQASLRAIEANEARERSASWQPSPAEQAQAARQQSEYRARESRLQRQQQVYDLVRQKNDAAAVEAVDRLAARGEATPALRMEQAYALERLGQTERALEVIDTLPAGQNGDLGLMRANLLLKNGRGADAYQVLKSVRDADPESLAGRRAAEQIAELPPALNLERWAWGELDLYGTYLARYGIGVAAGRLREGTYVPGARWIEPFVQAGFTLDSGSKVGEGITTIYNENLAGFHLGVRLRPFASQSFTLYFLGGFQNNLLNNPNYQEGWFGEVIAGVNGYWGTGPGTGWDGVSETPEFTMGEPAPPRQPRLNAWTPNAWRPFRTRFDWFLEGGGDWAYYSRLSDFIAYSQGRGGFRVLQFGRAAAVDIYGVTNLTFDSEGNYYDNFFEGGPGVRLVTVPIGAAVITTSAEYVAGAYLGRNANNTRGNTGAGYNDFRVTVALSMRW